ncbi:MAG: hypothetical protein U0531_17735 [Dehalococcoidia bacterium]
MGEGSRATWRLWSVILVFGMFTVGLIARLAHLQVIEHPEYAEKARGEHIDVQTLPAHRGALLDRNGNPLAISRDTWDVAVDRSVWSKETVGLAAADKLAPLLGRTAAEIYSAVGAERTGVATLARQVDYETGRQIISQSLPGVIIDQSSRRTYPEGDLAAALIGFTGRDQNGLTGLEKDADAALLGTPGKLWFERDSLGRPAVRLSPARGFDAGRRRRGDHRPRRPAHGEARARCGGAPDQGGRWDHHCPGPEDRRYPRDGKPARVHAQEPRPERPQADGAGA